MVTTGGMSLNEKIEQGVHEAVELLKSKIELETLESSTHRALIVKGWNKDEATINAIAKYLVGLRASALDVALNICSILLDDTLEGKIDLESSINEIVGATDKSLTSIQIRDERNPWLAEGIWHLCMYLSVEIKDCHPCGDIIAIGPVHVKAKDHGLDGIVLYECADDIGLTLIESKAYKDDPNRAIQKALKFFKEIDSEKHTTRIRQDVSNLRNALSYDKQRNIRGAFWKRNRTYIPNPHYDSSIEIDWTNKRESFKDLKIARDNIIIMPNIIDEFEAFFNKVSKEMREYSRSL